MKHPFKFWRVLLLVVLCVVAAFTMTSCGSDDEPKGIVIDYYLNVEEEFLVNGSTALTARYQNPKTRMQEAIRKVYPTPNATGADEAVFAACEAEYQAYREMYTGYPDHFTCLFRLIRIVKDGSRIKQSDEMRVYVYDINPKATNIED